MTNLFEQAVRQQLRITTNSGLVTIEQLYAAKQTSSLLNSLVSRGKELNQLLESSSDSEFDLGDTKIKSKEQSLLDLEKQVILMYINEYKNRINSEKEVSEKKKHNEEILKLIADKQKEQLANLSIEELQARLKQ